MDLANHIHLILIRIYSFWSKFNAMNLNKSDKILIKKPEIVQEEILSQFHDKKYIDLVKQYSKQGIGFLDSWRYARIQRNIRSVLFCCWINSYSLGFSNGEKMKEYYIHLILLGDYIMQGKIPLEDFVYLMI